MRWRGRLADLVILVAFAAILVATLRPSHGARPQITVWCMLCGSSGVLDVILNVALFVPLGVGLALARARRLEAGVLVFGTTLMVELLQYHVIIGREGTISDVLMNSIGGAVGFVLGSVGGVLARPSPRDARFIAAGGAVAWIGVLSLTAVALSSDLPAGAYRASYAPVGPSFHPFAGRVLSTRLNGAVLSPPDSAPRALPAFESAKAAELEADVVVRRPSLGTAAVVTLDGPVPDAMFLGQRGTTLVFASRVRATVWRLKTPHVILDGAFPSLMAGIARQPPGEDTTHVSGARRRDALVVTARHGTDTRALTVPLSATLGWSLLLPFDYSLHPGFRLWSALWVIALLAPVGYWSRHIATPQGTGRDTVVALLTPTAAIIAGLALVPPVFGRATTHWSEWAAAVCGVSAGWLAGTVTARRVHAGGESTVDRLVPRRERRERREPAVRTSRIARLDALGARDVVATSEPKPGGRDA